MKSLALIFLSVWLLWSQPLQAQTPGPQQPAPTLQTADKPVDKCTIEGQVVNAVTGEPLKKAHLILRRAENRPEPPSSTSTDASGRFTMQDIEPGRYRLWVERNGFVRCEYGARAPTRPGTTLALDFGQRLTNVVFRLMPHSIITGRVLDEDGEPVSNVSVQAMRYSYVRGKRQLAPASSASTNDLGEYRMFGIAPGRYFISATYRSMTMMYAQDHSATDMPDEGYAPTYYPGTNDPVSAAPLEVGPGQQMRGIDLTLLRTRTSRVRGRVTNMVSSRSGRNVVVMLMPRDSSYMGFFGRNVTPVRDPQGKFEIRGVTPGSYIISAEWYEDNKRYSARQPLNVGSGNVDGINLTITEGAELVGYIRVEERAEINLTDLRVSLQPRDSMALGMSSASVKDDGSFVLRNVGPENYLVNLNGMPENYYIKSVRMGEQVVAASGVDLTGGAGGQLQITLSPSGGQIEGVVLDSKQQPTSGAHVVLVPQARHREETNLFKNGTTDQYGRFTLRGISPGEYKLFAWEDIETGAYQDPDFLKPFENRGETVNVRENGRESAQLKLIPAEDTPAQSRNESTGN